jgi:hypothetical protein
MLDTEKNLKITSIKISRKVSNCVVIYLLQFPGQRELYGRKTMERSHSPSDPIFHLSQALAAGNEWCSCP